MKRVYCLYRVSTKKQVDKNQNDIPMQRIACHEFMQYHPDWTILKEFEEKGVSGFKISAENRDAIQEQQREKSLTSCLSSCLTDWDVSTVRLLL